jgi:hypothetical protein
MFNYFYVFATVGCDNPTALYKNRHRKLFSLEKITLVIVLISSCQNQNNIGLSGVYRLFYTGFVGIRGQSFASKLQTGVK